MEDMSFQVSVENCPDGGGDHSTSQEWWTRMFWRVILSLSVMLHEASLTSGSQTSGGDVDL